MWTHGRGSSDCRRRDKESTRRWLVERRACRAAILVQCRTPLQCMYSHRGTRWLQCLVHHKRQTWICDNLQRLGYIESAAFCTKIVVFAAVEHQTAVISYGHYRLLLFLLFSFFIYLKMDSDGIFFFFSFPFFLLIPLSSFRPLPHIKPPSTYAWLGNAALRFLSDYTEMLFLAVWRSLRTSSVRAQSSLWRTTFPFCPFCACCVGGRRPIFNPGRLRLEGNAGVNCSHPQHLMDVWTQGRSRWRWRMIGCSSVLVNPALSLVFLSTQPNVAVALFVYKKTSGA